MCESQNGVLAHNRLWEAVPREQMRSGIARFQPAQAPVFPKEPWKRRRSLPFSRRRLPRPYMKLLKSESTLTTACPRSRDTSLQCRPARGSCAASADPAEERAPRDLTLHVDPTPQLRGGEGARTPAAPQPMRRHHTSNCRFPPMDFSFTATFPTCPLPPENPGLSFVPCWPEAPDPARPHTPQRSPLGTAGGPLPG